MTFISTFSLDDFSGHLAALRSNPAEPPSGPIADRWTAAYAATDPTAKATTGAPRIAPEAILVSDGEWAPGPLPGNPALFFDGERLVAFDSDSGEVLREWEGVSGELDDGETTQPELSDVPFQGPIPEGGYTVDSDVTSENKWYKLGWGNESAWGNVRTEIAPLDDTDTFGRDGMFVHGGDNPGSAGCIDLTDSNNDFHDWLAEQDEPVDLIVDYDGYGEETDVAALIDANRPILV